ncbi:MAG: hypothetical protein ACI89X_000296 [Planctomycetota bacterium]
MLNDRGVQALQKRRLDCRVRKDRAWDRPGAQEHQEAEADAVRQAEQVLDL